LILIGFRLASGDRVARATSTYQNEALRAANTRRAAHCSPPLKLDAELNQLAQKRADEICRTNKFDFRSEKFRGKFIGENLYRLPLDEPVDVKSQSGELCSIEAVACTHALSRS
jgi:hypothetical protein